jgi:hypothetical protein
MPLVFRPLLVVLEQQNQEGDESRQTVEFKGGTIMGPQRFSTDGMPLNMLY